jgi:protein-disulfide isomerase
MPLYPQRPMASRIEEKQRAREARLDAERAAQREAKRRTSLLRLGLVLGLAAVVVVIAIVVSGGSDKTTTASGGGSSTSASSATSLFSDIPQKGVMLGDAKAKATLIEFADLQCPFCAEYSKQALPTVVSKYVRTGKLRYELLLRSFLGKDSVTAAGAAAAATKENRLYQFADLFYARQGEENSGYVTDSFISGIAKGAGVDPAAAVAASKNASSQPLVRAAEQQAAALGSNSTPSFYLKLASGRLVPVQPSDLTADAMTKALDAALAQT